MAERDTRQETPQSVFADTLAVWHLADMSDSSGRNNTLKLNGEVKIGVDLTGQELEASNQRGGDGKVAVFDRKGSLLIEEERAASLRPSGEALTVCTRVRLLASSALLFSDYFSLVVHEHGLVIAFIGSQTTEGRIYREMPLAKITFNQWHDLIVRYIDDTLEFFSDGVLLNTVSIEEHICAPFSTALELGAWRFRGETTNRARILGAIDHVILWDRAITDTEIAMLSGMASIKMQAEKSDTQRCLAAYNRTYDASITKNVEACTRLDRDMRKLMARDANRPAYHLTAPLGWMFDPVGAYYYNETYHVYTYRNIFARLEYCSLDHYASRDLIHWDHMPVGLWADSEWDIYGVWLGNHCIDDNGVPNMIYTGLGVNGKYGVRARSHDGLVSYGSKQGVLTDYAHHDGHTWKDGDTWYTITCTECPRPGDLGSALMMFSSADLQHWSEVGEVFSARKRPDAVQSRAPGTRVSGAILSAERRARLGLMEFPYLLPFEDRYVLMAGVRPARYWVGQYDKKRCVFTPDDSSGRLLNYLDCFYCFNPMIVDSKGPNSSPRRVMLALESRAQGCVDGVPWYGAHLIPRTLRLEEQRLIQEPVIEVERLRGRHYSQRQIVVEPGAEGLIEKDEGDTLEIIAEFDPGNSKVFGLKVRMSRDRKECARIFYDSSTGNVGVDGSVSKSPFEEQGQGPAYIERGTPVRMRVFLDRPILEVFVNGNTLTSVFELDSSCVGLDLFSEGGTATCKRLDIWEMKPLWPSD